MRITRELLLKHARENSAALTAKDRSIICIYISGSLLQEDPFIGGITDIDLICVHNQPVARRREVLRLSHEVNLDLAHYEQEEFEPARQLRHNAWIGGWFENVPIVLYDALRWYDFTRASATAQFWRPEYVASRARSFLNPARKTWNDLEEGNIPQGIKRVTAYLGALRDTANAVAVFSGAPLAERRLLMELPARAAAAGLSGLFADFVSLFTSSEVSDENFTAWVSSYVGIFEALKQSTTAPVSLSPYRRGYYEKALNALYPHSPAAAVWLMVYTWTKAAAALPRTEQPYKDWQELCRQLDLESRDLPTRLELFDAVLDTVEEAVDHLSA
ncbi:MAG TPA: hypothetical protein PKZ26_09050 [Anaerolineaceae bacterium]|jgi:hypothetical protein|nr:hypothetical protein [Chloroflexota bacterium]HNS06948.1 hypothetical protein [Anaerolineaceae bacterium]HNW13329.1 hypothetical protein [Anaerolineaceae bacterium]HOE02210.1 hypothetical protein [Anaerolineaceae bacterium]HOQ69579.1 hypothetical protein [Anaerolineaceae bacterium]